MSEMPPEQGGENMLTRRYGGIPGWAWMAGAAVIVYFLFLRGKGGSSSAPSSSGGGGTATTGNIQIQPGTTTVQFTGGPQASNNPPVVSQPAPVPAPGPGTVNPGQPSQSGVPNPQPAPPSPPRTSWMVHHVTKPAAPASGWVTVGKWPGKGVKGLAQWNTTLWGIAKHEGTTVSELLKLNPNIKNPSLIYPGQRVKVPAAKAK